MIMTRKQDRTPGLIVSYVFLILQALFAVVVIQTDLISLKYTGVLTGILLLWLIILHLLVRKYRRKLLFWMGVILMIISIVAEGVVGIYLYKTSRTLDSVTGINSEKTQMDIYIKKDSDIEMLMELTNGTFGILKELDRENTDKALEQIFYKNGQEPKIKEYDSLSDLSSGILNEECDAVILNRAYQEVLQQIKEGQNFLENTRILDTEEIESLIERKQPKNIEESDDKNTSETKSEDVSTIYISGIDTRGEITASSLSDVNIILTMNRKTKQILMVSTPRDYYVPLSISDGKKDKLTHAGIYGINVCMDTLKMLYGIDIDYYFRLNFGGFIKIIDTLGGITIDSDYEFDTQNAKGYHFKKGKNQVNGEEALAFCRERYSFAEGDRQRGRNQMAVIRGVADKLTSTELLKNYLSLLDSIQGCFESNIPYEKVAEWIQGQLAENARWTILSYSVDGTGDTQKPYSMSQNAYVMVPDTSTVEKAQLLMQKVREGFLLSDADVER